jgi:hypothetical protein
MKKMRAAGDERDGWIPRTLEEISDSGYADALHTACIEIEDFAAANIVEEGQEWTRLQHGLGTRFDEERQTLSKISTDIAKAIALRSENSPQSRKFLLYLASIFVEQGDAVPGPWRTIVAAHLRDSLKPQSGQQASTSNKWARNFMINHVARILSNRYDLKLERGKESDTIAASDIIFHAIQQSRFDNLGLGTIQNIIFDPEDSRGISEKNRVEFEEIRATGVDSLFDDYLE